MADLGSQLLGVRTPRKPPSGLSSRRSNVSLRQSGSLAQDLGGAENDGGQRFTLAHELAAALMPDPGASSRMLADEFGIELEDEEAAPAETEAAPEPLVVPEPKFNETLAHIERSPPKASASSSRRLSLVAGDHQELPTFRRPSPPPVFEQDPFLILNQSLKSTDLFITNLRRLDVDHSQAAPPTTQDQSLEQLATDIIRRIDETTRQREEQVRELLGYEREFRKISGEIGGNDLLGDLEELEHIEGLVDETYHAKDTSLGEEEVANTRPVRPISGLWEDARDPHNLESLLEEGEEDEEEEDEYSYEEPTTPAKDTQFLPPAPTMTGPPTPSSTIPHLTHMRTINQSLISSLGTISEQAQVNGAVNTEAGRKIRALKNKLGTWKSEFESAERSRRRVEKWEVGIWDDGSESYVTSPTRGESPPPSSLDKHMGHGKRIDARKIVEEELRAFSKVLQEVDIKTKAIMSSA